MGRSASKQAWASPPGTAPTSHSRRRERLLETAAQMAAGRIGRSPIVALIGTRPAIKCRRRLPRRLRRSTAPSAPCAGSFRSTMSAPAERAVSASATSRTLARKRVMGKSCGYWHARSSRTMTHQRKSQLRKLPSVLRRRRLAGAYALAPCGGPPKKPPPSSRATARGALPGFRSLSLIGVAVWIGDHHGDGLPVPLGGRFVPQL